MRNSAKVLLWMFLLVLACRTANAVDLEYLVFGRTTAPKNARVINGVYSQTSPRWSAPENDTVYRELTAAYGLSDRLTLETGLELADARRTLLRADRVNFEGIYRLVDDPFQVTPRLEIAPSLRGGNPEIRFGSAQLKNLGKWTFLVDYETVLTKSAEGGLLLEVHRLVSGAFYHFGLHGISGTKWNYETTGANTASAVIGGSVGKNIFLGIEQEVGLRRPAPDSRSTLFLSMYFGPYALGSWDL